MAAYNASLSTMTPWDFFLRQHGFVACDQDEAGNIRFNVYSINKKGASTYHLVFTNENKEPLRNYSGLQDQINEIEKFCAVVKEATDTYLKFITTRTNHLFWPILFP